MRIPKVGGLEYAITYVARPRRLSVWALDQVPKTCETNDGREGGNSFRKGVAIEEGRGSRKLGARGEDHASRVRSPGHGDSRMSPYAYIWWARTFERICS